MSAALLLLSLALAPGEPAAEGPKFSGRTLREWLADLKNDDILVREEAVEVLGGAGSAAKEAVPALERLLKDEPITLRMRAGLALFHITGRTEQAAAALIEALREETGPQTRAQLITTLLQLGQGAKDAAPFVLDAVDHEDPLLRSQALVYFSQLGGATLPAVIERLGDKELRRRRQAATIVARLGTVLGGHAAAVEKHLADEDRKVRAGCARALWMTGNTSRAVVDALAETVRAGNAEERRELMDSLMSVAIDKARLDAARPVFDAALKSSDLVIRLRAAGLMCSAEPDPEKLLPIFMEGLKSPNRNHWGPAAQGISKLGAKGAPAVALLVERTRSQQYGIIWEFGEAFMHIGAPAVGPLVEALENAKENDPHLYALGNYLTRMGNVAAPKMLPLLEHKNPRVRSTACQVLGSAPEMAAKSASKLAERLKDEDHSVRIAALNAFSNLGPAANSAVPAILELNKTLTGWQRVQCLNALERIGAGREALPTALDGLKETEPAVRGAALSLLSAIDPRHPGLMEEAEKLLKLPAARHNVLNMVTRLGPAAAKLAPALIELLRTERNLPMRQQLVPPLGRIGPAAKAAAPLLVELLKEPDQYLRQVTLTALQNIGGADPKTLVPALLPLLRDRQTTFYHPQVMDLLGKQGPAAAEAVPALLEELKRPEVQMQPAAAAALARIDLERARKDGIPLLEKGLASASPVVIAQAILELDKKHAGAMKTLKTALKEADDARWWFRVQAISTFGTLGPAAKDVLPDLRTLLKDKQPAVRYAAAVAVWRVGKDAEAALNTLTADLDPAQPAYLLNQAVFDLGQMGPAAKPAVPALLKLRKHSDASVRFQVASAVKAIDPEAAAKAGLR
jgi:HEAT repeat protein